nr:MAG TPA: hypothetical protein [Caudoviricetes sp.]
MDLSLNKRWSYARPKPDIIELIKPCAVSSDRQTL